MTNLALYASHYRKLGLPVTRVSNNLNEHNFYHKNLLKTPDHEWQHLFNQPQSADEFTALTWEGATGIGTVSGLNSLLVIDIDGCTDYKLLNKTLDELKLPVSYEWVVTSGSGSGFHIFVYADKFSIQSDTTAGEHVVTTFMPNEGYLQRFDKIEFLWKTHVVLPPSLHHTGHRYEFLNCRLPRALPQRIEQAGLYDVVRKHCEAEFVEGMNGYRENEFQVVNPDIPSDLQEWNAADIKGYEVFCIVCVRTENDVNLTTNAALKQIAWVVMDISGKVYARRSYLLRPLHPVGAFGADVSERIDQDALTIFKELNRDLRACTVLVSFDVDPVLTLLQVELEKHFLYHELPRKRLISLMNQSRGNQSETLADLYQNLFRYDVHQIADAESDALIMAKCLRFILKRQLQQDEYIDSIYHDSWRNEERW